MNRDTFRFAVQAEKLADAELYDGHYLLRSNLTADEPAWLWKLYMLLVETKASSAPLRTTCTCGPSTTRWRRGSRRTSS
ncbi:MAG: hypothetical protein HZA90_00120 [Verrucomicrobia bacterium]|nr:hypothetical protein [Verrucomicrobiota bacterium]